MKIETWFSNAEKQILKDKKGVEKAIASMKWNDAAITKIPSVYRYNFKKILSMFNLKTDLISFGTIYNAPSGEDDYSLFGFTVKFDSGVKKVIFADAGYQLSPVCIILD